ncbi:MAG: hypothetical protein L3J23_09610 [Flavobacteriaceae bacterium]|nr:hypothetical protein [Flavobacteriaceae bacterium]
MITMLVVSCDEKKKDDVDVDVNEVEEVIKEQEKTEDVVTEIAKDEHKCSDVKCSADCTVENCEKCAAKQAECKVKCDAKKANANGTETSKEELEKAKEGADKLKNVN